MNHNVKKAIKSNVNLPKELQPRCSWCICEKEDLCRQIEIPIKRIISQIEGKELKLLELCKKYDLEKGLCIVIHAEAMNLPEVTLPSCIVEYFGKLKMDIGFDIYVY